MENALQTYYQNMAAEKPLRYSPDQQVWLAHGYEICKSLFLNPHVAVPVPAAPVLPLVRISNGQQHEQARQAAMHWYNQIQSVDVGLLLKQLIPAAIEFDFVALIAKQLPVMRILKGLNFNEAHSAWIMQHLPQLVKLMAPQKSEAVINELNQLVPQFYEIMGDDDLQVVNLLGLFIQSYDAGRAMLTNAVLQLAKNPEITDFENMVSEMMRIDTPIHHTKRIAVADIEIDKQLIKAGQEILLVIAAANLDGRVFENPGKFDIHRKNKNNNLSFGAGGHACLAKYLVTDMVVATCAYLAAKYRVTIPEQEINYEPQLNARLHKILKINLNIK